MANAKKQDTTKPDARIGEILAMDVSKREKFARLADIGLKPAQIKDAVGGVSYAQVYVGLRTRTWFPDQPAKPRGRKPVEPEGTPEPAPPKSRRRKLEPEMQAAVPPSEGDASMQTFLKQQREGKRAERRRQQDAKARLAEDRKPGKRSTDAEPSADELAEIERESSMQGLQSLLP